jgi:hypothetical protein
MPQPLTDAQIAQMGQLYANIQAAQATDDAAAQAVTDAQTQVAADQAQVATDQATLQAAMTQQVTTDAAVTTATSALLTFLESLGIMPTDE